MFNKYFFPVGKDGRMGSFESIECSHVDVPPVTKTNYITSVRFKVRNGSSFAVTYQNIHFDLELWGRKVGETVDKKLTKTFQDLLNSSSAYSMYRLLPGEEQTYDIMQNFLQKNLIYVASNIDSFYMKTIAKFSFFNQSGEVHQKTVNSSRIYKINSPNLSLPTLPNVNVCWGSSAVTIPIPKATWAQTVRWTDNNSISGTGDMIFTPKIQGSTIVIAVIWAYKDCEVSRTFNIIVSRAITLTVPSYIFPCHNTSIDHKATGDVTTWYVDLGNKTYSGPNPVGLLPTTLSPGTYTVYLYGSKGGCISSKYKQTISIQQKPSLELTKTTFDVKQSDTYVVIPYRNLVGYAGAWKLEWPGQYTTGFISGGEIKVQADYFKGVYRMFSCKLTIAGMCESNPYTIIIRGVP